jgi:hypothetical protein
MRLRVFMAVKLLIVVETFFSFVNLQDFMATRPSKYCILQHEIGLGLNDTFKL